MPAMFIAPLVARVRRGPFLAAIDAQEWVEHGAKNKPHSMFGPSAIAAWEKRQHAHARRRNAAEKKLRSDELTAFTKWRALDAGGREAVKAILTDRP